MSWLKGKAHPGWSSPTMHAEPFFVEILFPCLQFRGSLAISPGHLQQKLTWCLSWPASACATLQTQFTNLAQRARADTALETQVTGKSYSPGRAAAVLFSYWSSNQLPITFAENIFQHFSKKGSMGGKGETLPVCVFYYVPYSLFIDPLVGIEFWIENRFLLEISRGRATVCWLVIAVLRV